jgi:hypothetical protein
MRSIRSLSILASMCFAAVAVGLSGGVARGDASTRPTGSITVHVVGQDTKPVAGATVLLIDASQFHHHRPPATQPSDAPPDSPPNAPPDAPPGGPGEGHHQPPPSIAQGLTDGTGTFVFTNIPDGRYAVMARLRHVGHGHAPVELTGDSATVTITLQPPMGEGGGNPNSPPPPAN